ncbi:MAG TPA: Clp protease N-terminal domain-containing protein [Acidimicrobiales bacterium]|nr:Clp protease N-terminal domain-containing protein [Acidimicrobiales bacterium]
MIDIEGFADDARDAVARAEVVARELGLAQVGTEHLLLGVMAGDSPAAKALSSAGATRAAARHKVVETAGGGGGRSPDGPLEASARAGRAIGRAHRFSHHDKAEAVGAQHLLLGILDVEGTAGQVLRGIGVDVGALRAALLQTAPGAASTPAEPIEPGEAAATICPSCRAAVDALTFRLVPATDAEGRTGEAVVFSCTACGVVLGASRAGERRGVAEA